MSSPAGRAATLLAFDYGEKRIGVAVGNSLTRSARPLVVVQNRNREYRFEELGKLIAEWKPDALVVGLPMHPDGAPHEMTQLAKRFGNQLNGRFNLPVTWAARTCSTPKQPASSSSNI
jgi:putative Holliday junction resolvase